MMTGEENVIPVCLESDYSMKKEFTARWGQFIDLLYILGILFGKLDLMVGGLQTASVYSVWSRKDVSAWEEEKVLLKIYRPENQDECEIREYNLIIERLNRNLAILGDLAAL